MRQGAAATGDGVRCVQAVQQLTRACCLFAVAAAQTVNFNTGVLHFRATPAALEFVDRWHAKARVHDTIPQASSAQELRLC